MVGGLARPPTALEKALQGATGGALGPVGVPPPDLQTWFGGLAALFGLPVQLIGLAILLFIFGMAQNLIKGLDAGESDG